LEKTFKIVIFLLFSFLSLNAKSFSQTAGDVLALGIPLSGYVASLYLDDKDAQIQFYKSYGSTMATTMVLKYSIDKTRPDGDGDDSFPSGHSSSAFSGASFIHIRYGFKYAIIPYIAAAYTAYTSVDSDRHYTSDVVAGAAIGIAFSWFFVTPNQKYMLTPIIDKDIKGVAFNYKF
jgi:membrane-associated phospholipid phosphatase